MNGHYRWLALMAVLAGYGCALAPANAREDTTLESARERWAAAQLEDYGYRITQSCFCPERERSPLHVNVADGRVTTAALEDSTPMPDTMDHLAKTVPEWFDYVKDAREQDWHKVDVRFDDRLGYPTRIDIDKYERMVDEEIELVIDLQSR